MSCGQKWWAEHEEEERQRQSVKKAKALCIPLQLGNDIDKLYREWGKIKGELPHDAVCTLDKKLAPIFKFMIR